MISTLGTENASLRRPPARPHPQTPSQGRPEHRRGDPASLSIPEALDRVLDLGGGGAANLLSALERVSGEDREGFLKALAGLLRHGVVGYEYRKINGRPHKVFIDVAIGSDLHRAPLVREGRFDRLI